MPSSRTALWRYDAEIEEWRLLFAAPEVGIQGPLSVYERIDRAIDELGADAEEAPSSAIEAMDVNEDLSQRLKGAVRIDPERKTVRLRKTVVNGKYIDDVLVYRAARDPARPGRRVVAARKTRADELARACPAREFTGSGVTPSIRIRLIRSPCDTSHTLKNSPATVKLPAYTDPPKRPRCGAGLHDPAGTSTLARNNSGK